MFLESLRKWASTWPAKLILAVLVASLGVFMGMSDIFKAHNPLNVIAKVGDVEILTEEFHLQFMRQVQFAEKSFGRRLSPEEIIKLRLPSSVLTQVVQQSLLDQEADRMQLVATDTLVRQAIQANPLFHDSQGKLDIKLFDSFLRTQRMSEGAYVAILRKELKRMQLIDALLAPLQVPPLLLTLLSNASLQKRQGAYFFIPAEQQSIEEKPDEQTLQAFYETYSKTFMQLESRTLTMLLLDKKALKPSESSPTEEDLKALFEKHQEDLFKGKKFQEVRSELEKLFHEKEHQAHFYALGKQIDDALASGETLEEVAQKWGLALNVVEKINIRGELPGNHPWPSNLPTAKAFQQIFLKKAFDGEAKEEQPLEWLAETDQAFVLRVDTIFPEKVPPFEEVRERVLKKWIQAHKYEAAIQKAFSLAAKLQEGEKIPVSFIQLPWISFQTLQEGTDTLSEEHKPLKEPLFEIGKGDFRVVPGATGVYVLKLVQLQQPTPEMIQKYAGEVLSKTTEMLKNDLLQAYVQSLKTRYMVRVNEKALGKVLASFSR